MSFPILTAVSRSKSPKILRATESGWELWDFQDPSSPAPQPLPDPAAPPVPPPKAIVALPARCVTILPLWLNSDDPALLPGMAEMQLASAGLTRNTAPEVRLVRSENGRSLVTALFLPSDPPAPLCQPWVSEFLPSPDTEHLHPDSVTVWAEDGHRVIAVTSGATPVYWESRRAADTRDLPQDLSCVLARFESEGVLRALKKIVLRLPVPPDLPRELSARFHAEILLEQRPPPQLPPPEAVRLVPAVVSQKRDEARRRQTILRAAAAVLLLIIGAAALLFGQQQALRLQNARLKRSLDAEEPRVAAVSAAQSRWAALRPALDPDLYPVERLLQASLLMPADGLRLSIFEQSIEDGVMRVILIGEAATPQAAFAFTEAVRSHPSWSMFQWQIPQPTILPNNAARFRMEGTFPYAASL